MECDREDASGGCFNSFLDIMEYRNSIVFKGTIILQPVVIAKFRRFVSNVAFLMKGKVENNDVGEVLLLRFFKVMPRYYGVKTLKEVRYFRPPSMLDKS